MYTVHVQSGGRNIKAINFMICFCSGGRHEKGKEMNIMNC